MVARAGLDLERWLVRPRTSVDAASKPAEVDGKLPGAFPKGGLRHVTRPALPATEGRSRRGLSETGQRVVELRTAAYRRCNSIGSRFREWAIGALRSRFSGTGLA
ncbi:MAG: hypothetical protein CM15mP120_12650 [Pseudomonadota bacterium]|nr:MAG: hypothetical protein CM15mP120_12650 [Pseudomonadota bacterium]